MGVSVIAELDAIKLGWGGVRPVVSSRGARDRRGGGRSDDARCSNQPYESDRNYRKRSEGAHGSRAIQPAHAIAGTSVVILGAQVPREKSTSEAARDVRSGSVLKIIAWAPLSDRTSASTIQLPS